MARRLCTDLSSHLGFNICYFIDRYGLSHSSVLNVVNILHGMLNVKEMCIEQKVTVNAISELLDCLDGTMELSNFDHNELRQLVDELSSM